MSLTQTHYRTCTLCEAMCGVEIKHDGQQVLSIKGDKKDPLSQGYICPKAVALKDLHEDPDRLRKPMERTANGWREISWQEAFDKAAAGIQAVQSKHGRNALASYAGNPNVHNLGAMLYANNLHHALGTQHRYTATSVDQLPHHILSHHLFGHQMKIPVPDVDRCSHFLMFGANPLASNGSIMSAPNIKGRLKKIIADGGKVITVDPRKTETAEIASEHYFIKPGSDVLLLLAMVNLLFSEGLISPGRLAAITPGLEEIESWVKPYTPERVAQHTGVSAAQIRHLVTDFVNAKAAVCYGRLGVSVQEFGLLSQYLIMVFNILTGRLDVPGGMMFAQPAADLSKVMSKGHFGTRYSRVRKLPEFGGEFPVSSLAEEILTEGKGQLKALVCMAGNPVLSTPNGQQLELALASLDYMVSIDFYLNETSRHANIVLPPVSPLERDHYDIAFHALAVRNTAKYSPAVFAPPKDGQHDWQIILELEKRLAPPTSLKERLSHHLLLKRGPAALLSILLTSGDYGGLPFFNKVSLRKLRRRQHGIDLGPLKPRLPGFLSHRDKKIHLHPDFYRPDLTRVENCFFGDDSKEDHDFVLIGRRHVRSCNSWLHNSHRLVKGKERCTLMINPADATSLGINEGDNVSVTSRTGTIYLPAELTDNIMAGVVSVPHGYGHHRPGTGQLTAREHAGVSINDISDEMLLDTLSGNAALNGIAVSVALKN